MTEAVVHDNVDNDILGGGFIVFAWPWLFSAAPRNAAEMELGIFV